MTSALAIVALVIGVAAATLPATATAADSDEGLVLSQFELEGTHGYGLKVFALREGDFPPEVIVEAEREALSATYLVPGELEPAIAADLGVLGAVEMRFQRRKRKVDRPEKGCAWIEETGTFRGSFSFSGEGGYTAAGATAVPGEVLRLPNGFCGFGDDRAATPPYPGVRRRTPYLAAASHTPHSLVQFGAAGPDIISGLRFSATSTERLGPIKITRSVSVPGEKGTFVVGPGKRPRVATVRPPAPFVGEARFEDPAGGPPTWTGSLSVSLPGAPDVALAGTGFRARVCQLRGLLSRCKLNPPR